MYEQPMTVSEMARMGGIARAKARSMAELQRWGKRGGRLGKLDRKAVARLQKLLTRGKSPLECASVLGVSVRTIGRVVARIQVGLLSWLWVARLTLNEGRAAPYTALTLSLSGTGIARTMWGPTSGAARVWVVVH
jgi:hypothetical protein